jgi:hypothetical protein
MVGGVLFAIHPVHVESVAWIIELKDVLSGAFCLAAILVFTREQIGWKQAALFLGCVLLAVFSKSVSVMLPVICAILMWWHRELRTRPHAALVMAAFALCAIYAWFDVQLAHGKGTAVFGISPAWRFAIAMRGVLFYFVTLLLPHPLMAIYPKWALGHELLIIAVVSALILSAFLTILGARGMRGTIAAILSHLAWLAPTLGLVQFSYMQYSYVADRYQYLASAPLLFLGAAILARGIHATNKPLRISARALGTCWILALAAVTAYQSSLYWSTERLFQHNARHNPTSPDVRNFLATGMAANGNWVGAAHELGEAHELRPEDMMLLRNWITALWRAGKLDRALEVVDAAVLRFPADQRLAELQRAIRADFLKLHPQKIDPTTPVQGALAPGRGRG